MRRLGGRNCRSDSISFIFVNLSLLLDRKARLIVFAQQEAGFMVDTVVSRGQFAHPGVAPAGMPLRLWTMSDIAQMSPSARGAGDIPPECAIVADWIRSYLMRPHADLGRSGDVCPFAAQATRLDLVRIGSSDAPANEAPRILATMEAALRVFDAIACKKSMRNFRTVVIAFPNCADGDGVRALKRTQNRLRHHSILRAKMIGCFEPNSPDAGLINADFRPLRSPIPLLAIRALVENDAPFVRRNPLLTPIYLAKFRLAALRRLAAARRA
jgi:hypothetical protein